jgi:hypothetical protein
MLEDDAESGEMDMMMSGDDESSEMMDLDDQESGEEESGEALDYDSFEEKHGEPRFKEIKN